MAAAELTVAAGATTHTAAQKYVLPHEVPNISTFAQVILEPKKFELEHGKRVEPEQQFHIGPVPVPINPLFSVFYALIIIVVIRRALRHATLRHPDKLQNAVEMVLGGLDKFYTDMLGAAGKKYIPYVGSLFLFILSNNLMCLVPLFKAPTSSLKTTVALGFCTFCYVHYSVIRDSGFKSWFLHLVGQPLWLAPLNFPLHVLGELIKPVSLSARLFGNILGEDKLLAAFLGIGMMITGAIGHTPTPVVGVPLQIIPFFLVILGSTIQATVFSVLAAVYIVLLLPHSEDHDEKTAAPKETAGAAAGHVVQNTQ